MCFLDKSQHSKGIKGFRGMRHKYSSQNVQKNGIRERHNDNGYVTKCEKFVTHPSNSK